MEVNGKLNDEWKMHGASPLKHGFVDLAAILFVIGGVVSLAMTILTLPITSIYPLTLPTSLTATSIVVLAIMVICSLGAIHCFSLATKRMLSEAGVRGLVFGALLLIFSLGVMGTLGSSATLGGSASTSGNLLTAVSAFLILIGGIICFSLRHTNVSASAMGRQHPISQPVYQQ
jgi:hypothetical protein